MLLASQVDGVAWRKKKLQKKLNLCTFDAPVFQSLLSTFNGFVDTSFVISNNRRTFLRNVFVFSLFV